MKGAVAVVVDEEGFLGVEIPALVNAAGAAG